MKNVMKTLMVCLIVTLAIVMVRSTAIAQAGFGFPPLWNFPSFSSQPLQVPTWEDPFNAEGDILVDNFEYWDSPYNHGWLQQEPAYPVYGFGMGYATIFNTVLDLQEGSRVLDVYRPSSVFLLSTPYERHQIFHSLFTPPSTGDPDGDACISMETNPVVSFDFRAPLGIEPWDIFELDVIGESADGDNAITVRIVPLQPPAGSILGPVNSTAGMYGIAANITGYNPAGQLQVTISIGRGMLDGSWHAVWVDVGGTVKAIVDNAAEQLDMGDPNDWYMARACAVAVSGQMFRLDNLMFRGDFGHEVFDTPDLFEMGPLYAQIFEPYRYLFIADYLVGEGEIKITDLMLSAGNFLSVQDPNDPDDPVVKYWTDEMGADPNLFGENDPNVAEALGRESFVVDLSLPIFADPNLRAGSEAVERIIQSGTLGWNSTIGGYGANGIQSFLLQPLPVYPYDGVPTYIPAKYSALAAIVATGKPYFGPAAVYMLEGALWNAGFGMA
jgi:hypothetical protein